MFKHSRELEIEWGDCDAAGIVFYPRYFAMFDASTAYLLEAAMGMKKAEWTKHFDILGIPMVDTGASFKVPSKYGDVIRIESEVSAIGRTSFEIRHKVFKGDVLAIEAHEKRVWVAGNPEDPKSIAAKPLPEDLIARLRAESPTEPS